MKRSLIIMPMMIGIFAVLFWTAPLGAKNKHEHHSWGKQVVFESQLICLAAAPIPPPGEGPPADGEAPPEGESEEFSCEDCGGEVTVFTEQGKTYVTFNFVTPIPDGDYYLYMGMNYAGTYQEIQFGEIVWDYSVFPPAILYIENPIVVTTDEDGECHAGPIELDSEITGVPPGMAMIQTSFSVNAVWYEGGPPGCGDYLVTGVPISE